MMQIFWAFLSPPPLPKQEWRKPLGMRQRMRLSLPALLILIVSLLQFHALRAQDFGVIAGRVTDDLLHKPIAGVVVTASPDGRSAVTDQDGRYRIERIMPGQVALTFQSAFHVSAKPADFLLREGESKSISVELHPLVLKGRTQEVTASSTQPLGTVTFGPRDIEGSPTQDVGHFLQQKGYYLQSDGRSTNIALRGLSSQRAVVLVDGSKLNPNGGAVDLSSIPLSTIQSVEVVTSGATSRFGADALAGAVNIMSKKYNAGESGHFAATSERGSYSSQRQSVDINPLLSNKLSLLGNYNYTASRNDFNFTHPYLGEQKRVNNFNRQYSGYLAIQSVGKNPISLSARVLNNHSGVPGAVLQETPTAASERENYLLNASYQFHLIEMRASYRLLNQSFHDPGAVISYDQHYLQVGRQLDLTREFTLGSHLTTEIGGEYLAENFFNDDLHNLASSLRSISRRTESAYIRNSGRVLYSNFTLRPVVEYRLDRVDNRSHRAPHFGSELTWSSAVDLSLAGNYAESYRLPPIDALFWNDDVYAAGNPDLHSERAINRDVSFKLESRHLLNTTFSSTWFRNDIDGMIYWRQRFDGKYSPVNLARAHVSGLETAFGVATKNNAVSVEYHRTRQHPTNESELEHYAGLVLPFQPARIDQLNFQVQFWRIRADYDYSFTGARFIREANTKSLPGYHLHDLTLRLTTNFLKVSQEFGIAARNLGNASYQVLERIPMSPRTINAFVTFKI